MPVTLVHAGDTPSFNMLMDKYRAAKNSLEAELWLAENILRYSIPILDWPIPSTDNDRCALPLIPCETPPDLCAVAPALSADPCPTPPLPCLPCSDKYVPPHRRTAHSPRRSSNYARLEPECNLCTDEQHHRLWNCYAFLEMKPYDRLMYVINKKLCHNCLLPNHDTHLCGKKSICSVPDCGMKHTKFIHVSGLNSDLFTTQCYNYDVSKLPASSHLRSVDVYAHSKPDFDVKLEMAAMINEMKCLFTSIVHKLDILGLHASAVT